MQSITVVFVSLFFLLSLFFVVVAFVLMKQLSVCCCYCWVLFVCLFCFSVCFACVGSLYETEYDVLNCAGTLACSDAL